MHDCQLSAGLSMGAIQSAMVSVVKQCETVDLSQGYSFKPITVFVWSCVGV